MNYKSAIAYIVKQRNRQPIKHFAELYNIDLSGLNSNPAMIDRIKEVLTQRHESGANLKG